MCGIAGYFGTKTLDPERIRRCLSRMKHRGPDAANWYHHAPPGGRQAYLLHTRLSIIDLNDRANQPYRTGGKSLAYNGELYNYLELKPILREKGASFHTDSDTEVLMALLDRLGWRGLDHAEGMWAFALYDERAGSLLLSRDRFGEKPLFLYRDKDGIYFASEVKFIFELLGRKLPINANHLYRYLVNGYKSLYKGKEFFFQGIEELDVSSVLIVNASGEETKQRYWTPRFEPKDSMTYPEAVEGARDALIASVKLRLRADVPMAFCMSGGIDSNSLISIAKRKFNYNVHGFTITNTDARYEENDLVNHAVRELEIRHTAIPVNPQNFLSKLRQLVRQHDAPVYTITYFAHWLLMESIHQHGYKISVSGTAADELFTGYYDHHLAYLREVQQEPAVYATSLAAWNEHIRPMVRNPFLKNPSAFIENPTFRDHIFLNAEEFSEYLRNPWSETFHEEHYTESLLRNRMMNEMFHEAVPVILHEDDHNAMSFSIENRSPFLDRHLFEFCFGIPSRHLIRNGFAKAILRDAMRGIVPERILDSRRKVGFNAPIFSFLDVKDPEVRGSLLDESPVFDHLRRDRIETLIQKAELPNSESKFLFYFLTSKLFVEEFAS